jgi:hypothetical protein
MQGTKKRNYVERDRIGQGDFIIFHSIFLEYYPVDGEYIKKVFNELLCFFYLSNASSRLFTTSQFTMFQKASTNLGLSFL